MFEIFTPKLGSIVYELNVICIWIHTYIKHHYFLLEKIPDKMIYKVFDINNIKVIQI